MDNYRAKEVLEYTKTLDNIQGTASSIAIDIGIIALDKIENTSQKLESLIDNMEIYTAGRPNSEKVQVRKTTATNICKRGGSDDAAGEYLGHAPKNVTGKHYTYKGDRYVEQIFHNYVEAV